MSYSRRSFSKKIMTSFCCGLTYPIFQKKLLATENCQKDIKDDRNSLVFEEERIQYWIDGALENNKAHLAILLKVRQTSEYYVKKVVLTNSSKVSLAIRYLTHCFFIFVS